MFKTAFENKGGRFFALWAAFLLCEMTVHHVRFPAALEKKLAAALAEYPLAPGATYVYGTAGFRTRCARDFPLCPF